MLSFLKDYENKKQLIGFIINQKCDYFAFIIMDSITQKTITTMTTQDPKNFVDQFSTIFSNNLFKAIIVDVFQVIPTPSRMGYDFPQELRQKLNELKIPAYFIANETYLCTSLLIASNVEVGVDESVLLVMPCKFEHVSLSLLIVELKFTKVGYQQISHKILAYNEKASPSTLCAKICGSKNPSRIIVSGYHCKIPFKKIFKSKNCVILPYVVDSYREKFIVETCKWLLDKSYVRYHIVQKCAKSIHVYGSYGPAGNAFDILKIEEDAPLPITKSALFTKSVPELFVKFEDRYAVYYYTMPLSKNCHGYEVTVTIDEENFEEINFRTFLFPVILDLPSRMDALLEAKIPFIGFFQNSSVIGIYNASKKGYEFLDECNGLYGITCFISFDQKKPNFGQEAMDAIKTKNTFVVFDLIKIMSMPPGNIKADKTWGFTFTENADNPVLLEFDNFDGTKKAASPSFLMAMYLRQHLKAIEEKTGKKPKEIAIYIMKEYEEDEMDRIKNGLKESCQLLKLDACFADTDYFKVDFVKFCRK